MYLIARTKSVDRTDVGVCVSRVVEPIRSVNPGSVRPIVSKRLALGLRRSAEVGMTAVVDHLTAEVVEKTRSAHRMATAFVST